MSKLRSTLALFSLVFFCVTLPAQATYNTAQLSNKKKAEEHWKRGSSLAEKKHYKQAAQEYSKAIKLDPTDGGYWCSRGICYIALKNYNNAIGDISHTISLNPKWPDGYAYRALAYSLDGNYSKAIADYNKLISMGEKKAYVYLGRGRVYHEMGNTSKASIDYKIAIKLEPSSSTGGEARKLLQRLKNHKKPEPMH
jgi:tetratricopeptide (TPR) repeat protein